MTPCNQCGASLPDNAQFCLQCGTRVQRTDPQDQPTPPPKLDFIQPALAGGLALGILSALPFFSAGNVCCCMWAVGGGGLASYLLLTQRPAGITYGDGAFGGVLSGLFGSLVATIIGIPVRLISAQLFGDQRQAVEEWLNQAQMEGPFREFLLRMASSEISTAILVVTFVMQALLYSLFAMIGGILMVAVIERRKP